MHHFIITGTSSGLGKSIFDYCLEKNQSVTSISRRFSSHNLEQEKNSKQINLLKFDIADLKVNSENFNLSLTKSLNSIKTKKIIFINNAGTINPINSIINSSIDDIYKSTMVNFFSPIQILKIIYQYAIDNTKALEVLNISTGAAKRPITGWSAYCSSKAGFSSFIEVLKLETENNELINVSQMDPGVLDTNMQRSIRSSNIETFPDLDKFSQLKNSGSLKDPKIVAKEIVDKFI